MNSKRNTKISALVMNAIRKLQDVQGSSTKEINNYISQEYDVPSRDIRRKVQVALRRGLQYGIFHKDKGGYYVCKTLSPTHALSDIQDNAFCKQMMCKKKKSTKVRKPSCKRMGSRKSRRSRSKKCPCKKGMKRKSRRKSKSSKRKCAPRRSRTRSKKRSSRCKKPRKMMKKSCKRGGRSRSRKSKSKRSRSRSKKRCPKPRRPKKCNDLDINTSEPVKERNVNSSTSLNSEADANPGRRSSQHRSPDEGSD